MTRARMIVTVLAVLAAAFAQARTPAAVAQGSACDNATATPLVQPPSADTNGRSVQRVQCGAFMGQGSQAMLVVVNPQCGCGTATIQGWQLFVLVGGAWQPSVDGYHDESDDSIEVQGTSIVELRSIRRTGDWSPGVPTGGTQTRVWNWDGGAGLAASDWMQARPPGPVGEVVYYPRHPDQRVPFNFRLAGRPMTCSVEDGRAIRASCAYRSAPRASLGGDGRVTVCRRGCGTSRNLYNTLRVGQSVHVGRFQCRDETTGVRCVVVATGKGFVMNGKRVRRI